MVYDVVIVGAGPGGSTLARLLDEKYKVLLIDKRNLGSYTDNNKEKCCGGLLAPDAQNMLAKLGLGIPQEVLTGPQMFSVNSIDFDNNIERYYQRHYININREKFDRWLVSLIPNSVELCFNSLYKSYKKVDDYIEVKLNKDGENIIVKTKILVGADGAISRVREQTFEHKKSPDKYVSIQHWYKTKKEMPYYTSIFDKEITDFYSWLIQKEDSILIGTAIPIKEDANEKFQLLISKLKKQGIDIGEAEKKSGTLIMRTRKIRQINSIKDNVVLIGEAAGFISPSSAEGISYALKSGSILAKCINEQHYDFGKKYNKKTRSLKTNIIFKNLKSILMYNKTIRRWIMKSRILSMNIDWDI
ncbi:MAG: FAD-binding protein [Vallitalea sp.]|jgi:flavin-dependent dehydrogenase|nr:FAD-binding protein [Vallitalea sp.]